MFHSVEHTGTVYLSFPFPLSCSLCFVLIWFFFFRQLFFIWYPNATQKLSKDSEFATRVNFERKCVNYNISMDGNEILYWLALRWSLPFFTKIFFSWIFIYLQLYPANAFISHIFEYYMQYFLFVSCTVRFSSKWNLSCLFLELLWFRKLNI